MELEQEEPSSERAIRNFKALNKEKLFPVLKDPELTEEDKKSIEDLYSEIGLAKRLARIEARAIALRLGGKTAAATLLPKLAPVLAALATQLSVGESGLGIGLAIAGVPFTGLLTALMFMLCIAQIGPMPVLLGAAGWAFYNDSTGWAWARNSPFRFYKQNQFEGGIASPAIVHWPAGLTTKPGALDATPGSVIAKAERISRPSAVRMGMFCRLGSLLLKRPVTATACA